jgi:hypothetical protein
VPSPWPGSRLIPVTRALAEGGLLAVLYAALQAAGGELPSLGPIELAVLLGAGTAWGRRARWTSPSADAVGLIVGVVLSGAFCWVLDANVRASLIDGEPLRALTLHLAGWLVGGVAFWRGESHRIRDDDSMIDDRLMRWAVPSLAVPWLIGHLAASGEVEAQFAASAFVATVVFVGAGLITIGLARLEALRRSTVGYWRYDTSWMLMVVGIAVGMTVVSVPVAAVLGIQAGALLAVLALPLQTVLLIVALATAPAFILAAFLAGLLRGLLPPHALETFKLPSFDLAHGQPASDLPIIILSVFVASLFLFEFVVGALMLWIVFRDRVRRQDMVDPAFEERFTVVPERDARPMAVAPPPPPAAQDTNDPAAAYLAALDALQADGRWSRRPQETPAAHLARTRGAGLASFSFARLAAAYQLARYAARPLSARESARTPVRFAAFRRWLLRG